MTTELTMLAWTTGLTGILWLPYIIAQSKVSGTAGALGYGGGGHHFLLGARRPSGHSLCGNTLPPIHSVRGRVAGNGLHILSDRDVS
jgi:hypothetical protein